MINRSQAAVNAAASKSHLNYNREAMGHRETARDADRSSRNHGNGNGAGLVSDKARERFEGVRDTPYPSRPARHLAP